MGIYLQLKHSHKIPVSPLLTFNPPATSFSISTHDYCNHPHSMATNNNPSTEIRDQPIRRSQLKASRTRTARKFKHSNFLMKARSTESKAQNI
jgi:hypothetical protein